MWLYPLGALLWLAFAVALAIRVTRGHIHQAIPALANVLPPLAIVSCALAFFATPPAPIPPAALSRALHYTGIVLLFVFLLFGTFCQARVRLAIRSNDTIRSVAAFYRQWWIATRLLPAPAALCILLGGLRLVYESPTKGLLTLGWLFWLITSFSLFFFDGLMFYLPEICRQYRLSLAAVRDNLTVVQFAQRNCRTHKDVALLVHAASFPFVFALGATQSPFLDAPIGFVNWLSSPYVPTTTPPTAWQRVLIAASLVAIIGVVWLITHLPWLIRYIRFFRANPLPVPSHDPENQVAAAGFEPATQGL